MIQKNLAHIAQLKINIETLEKQYQEEITVIQKEMKEQNEEIIIDTQNNLQYKLTKQKLKEYNIEKVKELFGTKLIKETIDSKEFEKALKTEPEKAKQCYTEKDRYMPSWDGLKLFEEKQKLNGKQII